MESAALGESEPALLTETIGANLDRTVARFPDREALVEFATGKRWTWREFDYAELALIPALRAMRQVHHAGWIAQRWADPAFPAAFPFAAEGRWWEQHVTDLHEAADALA